MAELLAPKIYTPSGLIKENIFSGLKILDVGCGQKKLPGAVGIDINEDSQADIVHNINKTPWPFDENSFDLVFLNHVLEHVDDILNVMNEIHRILKKGGRVIVAVPYFRSIDTFTDPTHKHFFASHSMDYFIEGAGFCFKFKYTTSLFKKLGFWFGWPHPSKNPIKQLMKLFIHKFPDFYEHHLSLFLPVKYLTWELEAIK